MSWHYLAATKFVCAIDFVILFGFMRFAKIKKNICVRLQSMSTFAIWLKSIPTTALYPVELNTVVISQACIALNVDTITRVNYLFLYSL